MLGFPKTVLCPRCNCSTPSCSSSRNPWETSFHNSHWFLWLVCKHCKFVWRGVYRASVIETTEDEFLRAENGKAPPAKVL